MQEFLNSIGPFSWGFALGFFWMPTWKILKKVWQEAKIAKEEWRKPNGKSNRLL